MFNLEQNSEDKEIDLNILRLCRKAQTLQKKIANSLGLSLGKINF